MTAPPLQKIAVRIPDEGKPLQIAIRRAEGTGEAAQSVPPALLLHGLGLTSYSWRFVQERMSGSCDTIAVDLPTFGHSDKPADLDHRLPALARVIVSLMDALGLERAFLAGHSLGGGIALLAALQHPERVHRLALIGTVAYPQPEPPFVRWPRYPLSWLPLMLFARPMIRTGLEQVYLRPDSLTPDAVLEYAAPFTHSYAGTKALQRLCRALKQEELVPFTQQFPSLHVPTLVIHGDRDNVTPLWIAERLRNDLPNVEAHILTGEGHMLPEEEPKTVASLLCDFFRRSAAVDAGL